MDRYKNAWASFVALTAMLFLFSLGFATGGLSAPAKRDKVLDRHLSQKHPNGKGPSSTSAARGYYKGGNGQWKSR